MKPARPAKAPPPVDTFPAREWLPPFRLLDGSIRTARWTGPEIEIVTRWVSGNWTCVRFTKTNPTGDEIDVAPDYPVPDSAVRLILEATGQ